MKKIIYISFCLYTSLLIQSCEKIIEIELPNDQINTEKVFQDQKSATAALTNLYVNLRGVSLYSGGSQGIGTFLGLYADELEDLRGYSSNNDGYLLYNNSLDPTISALEILWRTSYSHIYAINAFINGVADSNTLLEREKGQLLAEGYILRAMYYSGLTQLFGDIPYTTTTNYKENTVLRKSKNVDVLKYIEQDLLQANAILEYEYRSPNKYYPNKAVSELLLAKNYLLQNKYDQAEYFARFVIDNPNYSIESDISRVFKNTAKSTIWQLSNSTSITPTLEAQNYIMLVSSWMYKINRHLINSFEANDLRKINWTKEYSPSVGRYGYKYKNDVLERNNKDECSILFRLEEAYFILTEALIYQDRKEEAVPYLNTIRKRAGLVSLPTSLSKDEVVLAMLEESRKELFLEHGRRFLDLKRNNKLSLLKVTKLHWEDKHGFLPLPEKELLFNPNLLPNNEGY